LNLGSRSLKGEWEDFEACFKRRRLGSLKHFTAVENLDSIVCPPAGPERPAAGLYCRRLLRRHSLAVARLHGWGGKADRLDDYICLSFHLPAGIVRREARPPAVLLIDLAVILWEGTCFCRTNSASRNISVEEILAYQDLAAFESLFSHAEGSRLRYRQAEVLVRNHISLERIQGILLPETAEGRSALKRLRWLKWRLRLSGRWRFPSLKTGSWQSFA